VCVAIAAYWLASGFVFPGSLSQSGNTVLGTRCPSIVAPPYREAQESTSPTRVKEKNKPISLGHNVRDAGGSEASKGSTPEGLRTTMRSSWATWAARLDLDHKKCAPRFQCRGE
jgi:hypothetical protein